MPYRKAASAGLFISASFSKAPLCVPGSGGWLSLPRNPGPSLSKTAAPPPGGTRGFRTPGDGSPVFIMAVWSPFCPEAAGNMTVPIYHMLQCQRQKQQGVFFSLLFCAEMVVPASIGRSCSTQAGLRCRKPRSGQSLFSCLRRSTTVFPVKYGSNSFLPEFLRSSLPLPNRSL